MERVYSLHEARDWFLNHSSGSVLCLSLKSDVIDDAEQECSTYEEAREFYTPKPVFFYYDE